MLEKDLNIVLIGMPGAGKTEIGKILASKLKMNFCDIDQYIEGKQGCPIRELFEKGEGYFRRLERKAVKSLSKSKHTVIATGGGVVLDARNIRHLKQNSIMVFINRPIKSICTDLDTRNRPLLSGNAQKIQKIYEERYILYKKYADLEIENDSDLTIIIDLIISKLKEVIPYESINN